MHSTNTCPLSAVHACRVFYNHAHAAAMANDTTLYRAHYAKAAEIGVTLEDEDRAIFTKTFAGIPAPRADPMEWTGELKIEADLSIGSL